MTDEEERNAFEEKLIAFKFCKGLFETSNLLSSDFDNIQVTRVSGGVQVTFIAAPGAVVRASEEVKNALGQLVPDDV